MQSILDQLDRARLELVLRISAAQVGVFDNIRDGLRVAFDVLIETNKKVNAVLGIDLVLADRLMVRELQNTGTHAG